MADNGKESGKDRGPGRPAKPIEPIPATFDEVIKSLVRPVKKS